MRCVLFNLAFFYVIGQATFFEECLQCVRYKLVGFAIFFCCWDLFGNKCPFSSFYDIAAVQLIYFVFSSRIIKNLVLQPSGCASILAASDSLLCVLSQLRGSFENIHNIDIRPFHSNLFFFIRVRCIYFLFC